MPLMMTKKPVPGGRVTTRVCSRNLPGVFVLLEGEGRAHDADDGLEVDLLRTAVERCRHALGRLERLDIDLGKDVELLCLDHGILGSVSDR